MSDLVVIVPSRGRPQAVGELARAFKETCTQRTRLWFALDHDDPDLERYKAAVMEACPSFLTQFGVVPGSGMVTALNWTALAMADSDSQVPSYVPPRAIAFMGDDHRPRTVGWDTAYLAALELHPGLVYGNDLLQGANLPTQVAMSAEVVRALGHMGPPVLTHLYLDNYWLQLGRAADCITYLPDVVVEHLHPVACKAEWDEGYKRVNDSAMYERDAAAFAAYWSEHGPSDVAKVREALSVAARG